MLKEFRERYPECDPVLTVGDTAEVLAMLREYRVAMGVVGELSGVRDGEFVSTQIAADELRLSTGAAHPLRTVEEIEPAHLREVTLLARERGSSTRAGADRLLGDLAVHFRRVVEVASAEAIKEAVIADLGVAVLSSWATRREEEQGLLYPVADRRLRMARRFYMVRRADRTLRGAAEAFWSAAARLEVMPSTPAAARRRASSGESTVQT